MNVIFVNQFIFSSPFVFRFLMKKNFRKLRSVKMPILLICKLFSPNLHAVKRDKYKNVQVFGCQRGSLKPVW